MATNATRPGARPPTIRQTAATRPPPGLDDEPLEIDIDTEDLPPPPSAAGAVRVGGPFTAGDWLRWAILASVALYLVVGLIVGSMLAFNGVAQMGWGAFARPRFYLVVLFWPVVLYILLAVEL